MTEALLAANLVIGLVDLIWKLRKLLAIGILVVAIHGMLVGAQPAAVAPSGLGVTYSFAELRGALEAAGVPKSDSALGAAIARAESGGRSDAVHLCPPDCIPGQSPERSYGPWQINTLAHPDVSPTCAMELYCAARVAARISNQGRDWSAWSTYDSGAYGSYLVP